MKSTPSLLAIALMAGAPVLAHATTLSINATGDNSYTAYLSNDAILDASDVSFASGTNWQVVTSGSTTVSSTTPQYVLVSATNADGPAMFAASLSLSDNAFTFANGTTSLSTDTAHWTASSSTDLTGAAAATAVSHYNGLTSGQWTLDTSFAGTAVASSTFIWTATTAENSTVYFATALTPAAAVPEPGTTALMLGGLGALGFLARRRKAQQA